MDTLPNDINQLKALLFKQSKVLEQLEIQNKQLAVLNADYTTEIARLTAQLDKLRRMTFGQSTEKVERKIQKVEKRLKELQDEAAVQGVAVTDPHVPPRCGNLPPENRCQPHFPVKFTLSPPK